MNKIIFAIPLMFVSFSLFAQLDLSDIPHSADEARNTIEQRRLFVFNHYAAKPMAAPPTFPQNGVHEFFQTGLSKLALKIDLDSVSLSIMRESFVPWLPGTEIALAGSVCKRAGDYDFTMMGLLHMAYLDEVAGQTLLSKEARLKLRNVLITPQGPIPYTHFKLGNCLPIKIKDTENHILMTNTARYLHNQLLLKDSIETGKRNDDFDNEKNGTNAWMLNHLSQFLKHDFDELNSRPYQGHAITPIALLYSYAESADVRTAAQLVLDYLSAKNAVQSMGLRRWSPFRRRTEHREPTIFTDQDSGMFWYSFHAGNHDFTEIAKTQGIPNVKVEDHLYIYAAIDKYKIPESIHRVFYHETKSFQRIKARDPEIYFASKNFLLSAGGRHRNVFGYFTSENNVWGVATNIMPRSSGVGMKDVFRLNGTTKRSKRNNLCVVPNFACGTNFEEADAFKGKAVIKGNWSFYKTADFNLAVYKDDPFALWEVQEPSNFEVFMDQVLKNNPIPFNVKKPNLFKTVDGHNVEFDWSIVKPGLSPVLSYDGVVVEKMTDKWPFASGDLIRSSGDGLVEIHSLDGSQVLNLDYRNSLLPKRWVENK